MEAEINPIGERRADPAGQLEIDEGILDYLAYKATKVLLRDIHKSNDPWDVATKKSKADLHLNMVDCKLCKPSLVILAPTETLQPSL